MYSFFDIFFQSSLYSNRFFLLHSQYDKSRLNHSFIFYNPVLLNYYSNFVLIVAFTTYFVQVKVNFICLLSKKKEKKKKNLVLFYKNLVMYFYLLLCDGETLISFKKTNTEFINNKFVSFSFFLFFYKYFFLEKCCLLFLYQNTQYYFSNITTFYNTVKFSSVLSYSRCIEEEEDLMYCWHRYVF